GPLAISDSEACRLRDLMTHRGPDDAGLWRGGGLDAATGCSAGCPEVLLAHRRLAVLDPTPAGHQPMVTPETLDSGRFVLVYNGELYNEPELRQRLIREGVRLSTGCDTETLLCWLASRGRAGLADLRGMYALALYDRLEQSLLLARDPLGIKPLYRWLGQQAGADLLLFASEPVPILEHPAVTPEPDLLGISTYLTTIRTVLGERTMFAGVRSLLPGQSLVFDLRGDRLTSNHSALGLETPAIAETQAARFGQVQESLHESVTAHLRADVPTCCLLSGGLDSAIITSIANDHHADLRTYCAGSPEAAPVNGISQADDFAHARSLAETLGTHHTEVAVDRAMFLDRWREMVAAQGVPLSTPNEVAINAVAQRLRADGCVVTLSGEGADEIFGGYDHTLRPAAAHIAAGNVEPGLFHLRAAAWCPVEAKLRLFTRETWARLDGDAHLRGWFAEEFAATARGEEPLADHLRFQRRVNLTGLLQRLDTATMLASVEGRTPFADRWVAGLAEGLPMGDRFVPPGRTKIALREAFAGVLPASIVQRPKASFPLPFQRWLDGVGDCFGKSALLRELVRPEVLSRVAASPGEHWNLAWPLANLAIWGE
ncbi:Asparagine synthetase [glutamine-hydrolyzing], partial [hydrothermal vent metagenome]